MIETERIDKYYCGKCKSMENLIKQSRSKKYQYYVCRLCKSERMHGYYILGNGKDKQQLYNKNYIAKMKILNE